MHAAGPSARDGGHQLPVSGRDSLAGSAESFGPWQTVWKRHRRYSADGTWDEILRRDPQKTAGRCGVGGADREPEATRQ